MLPNPRDKPGFGRESAKLHSNVAKLCLQVLGDHVSLIAQKEIRPISLDIAIMRQKYS